MEGQRDVIPFDALRQDPTDRWRPDRGVSLSHYRLPEFAAPERGSDTDDLIDSAGSSRARGAPPTSTGTSSASLVHPDPAHLLPQGPAERLLAPAACWTQTTKALARDSELGGAEWGISPTGR